MATRLNADGTIVEVAPAGAAFTLTELQTIVGGYIEFLYFDDGRLLCVNEDGKRLRLPVNRSASSLAWQHTGIAKWDVIAGDALLCGRQDVS
jgi:hypothetical protein